MFKGTKPLEQAQVGDEIGTATFTITEEMVERRAWANDDYNPWYMTDSPFGGRIASPAAALAFDGTLFYDYYAYPKGGSLFAKQEFEFLAPLKVGETYRLAGKLIEIFERKGRHFYRMGISVTNQAGEEVMRMAKTVATPVVVPPSGQ
jgi:acyl dehydratase